MFTYGEAETLLAKLHGIDDQAVQRGPFRARLKNFKKFGLPIGASPGSGQKVLYFEHHVYQWAFCLGLTEFGLEPAYVASFVHSMWDVYVNPTYEEAQRVFIENGTRTYIVFVPNILSAALNRTPAAVIGSISTYELGAEQPAYEIGSHSRSCWFEITPVIAAVVKDLEDQGFLDGRS